MLILPHFIWTCTVSCRFSLFHHFFGGKIHGRIQWNTVILEVWSPSLATPPSLTKCVAAAVPCLRPRVGPRCLEFSDNGNYRYYECLIGIISWINRTISNWYTTGNIDIMWISRDHQSAPSVANPPGSPLNTSIWNHGRALHIIPGERYAVTTWYINQARIGWDPGSAWPILAMGLQAPSRLVFLSFGNLCHSCGHSSFLVGKSFTFMEFHGSLPWSCSLTIGYMVSLCFIVVGPAFAEGDRLDDGCLSRKCIWPTTKRRSWDSERSILWIPSPRRWCHDVILLVMLKQASNYLQLISSDAPDAPDAPRQWSAAQNGTGQEIMWFDGFWCAKCWEERESLKHTANCLCEDASILLGCAQWA